MNSLEKHALWSGERLEREWADQITDRLEVNCLCLTFVILGINSIYISGEHTETDTNIVS